MIYSACNIGLKRTINQDSIYTSDKLIAVADGMGGHSAGEIASRMACEAIQRFENIRPNIKNIHNAFDSINDIIYQAQCASYELHTMGTTLTAMWIGKKTAWIGHVGDSRAYVLRHEQLTRLTHDHSYVGNLLSLGIITEEEARVHRFRNQIDRAIGIESSVISDVVKHDIRKNDIFMLCSDGLSSMVTADDICKILINSCDPANELVDMANANGGADNISAIVYKES